MKQILITFFLLILTFVNATIINVPGDQPTIQAGINVSSNTDTVLVQPGTYIENINYVARLITVGSLFLTTQDTAYISSTFIDGNFNDSVIQFTFNEDSTAVLCGFTITNGNAVNGGGIYCDGSSPSLENITISGNNAVLGGGIYCDMDSNPSIQNVTILSNIADTGGGIYCNNSNPNLEYVNITGNYASGLDGGGIYCYYSNPSLENVTISDNVSEYGGGLYCYQSSPNLVNVTITGHATGFGGGIYCYMDSSPNLHSVTISNNAAGHGGGIYCDQGSSPSLEYVILSDNGSTKGGGIYCYESCYPSLDNVTISGNFASQYGGGIYCEFSNANLINSILWNNSPQEIYGSASATYSDIEGGWAGEGNIDSDPLFADPANGNYHLTEDSPCIDAGDPSSPLDPDGTITDMGAWFYPQFIPPEADFEADVILGEAPLEVQFSDLTVPNYNPIISWHWDFNNDGAIDSNEQNPVYIYEEMGIYTISLTVSDGYLDDTEIKDDYIEVTGAGVELNIAPLDTFLYKNYPNPFNPLTIIKFDIKEFEIGILKIFNIKGQLIESHQFETGEHNFQWDASSMSSGVYFYQLQTESTTVNKKMLLLK